MERCDGCGLCVEACPQGALYLVEGKANVDTELCRECELCVDVCPVQAIAATLQPATAPVEPVQMPVPCPEPEVVRVQTEPRHLSFKSGVLPVMGAALVWAGREIVPHVAEYLLDSLGRWAMGKQSAVGGRDQRSLVSRGSGAGRRHRRRRRGGE